MDVTEKTDKNRADIDSLRVDVTGNRQSIESLKEQVNEMTDKIQKPIKSLHDLVCYCFLIKCSVREFAIQHCKSSLLNVMRCYVIYLCI